jgi:hypothetical protein
MVLVDAVDRLPVSIGLEAGTFPSALLQPSDSADGRRSEEPLVLAAVVRGIVVPHAVAESTY